MRQTYTVTATLFTLAGSLLVAIGSAEATVYCWKDENSQTQCGDHVPTQYISKDRQVKNDTGQTVKVLPHAKTDAELAADKRAEQEKQAQAEQARYDQYLISTFDTVDGLTKMRDERLGVLDGSIRITEMSLQNSQASLEQLKARRERLKSNGKPPPPDLVKQITDQEQRIASDQKGLETRKQERQALSAKFERDIVRYRYLKGGAGTMPAGSATN